MWRLVHHFVDSRCDQHMRLERGRFPLRRTSKPRCPADHGSPISQQLGPAVTDLLRRRGIDYDPAGEPHSLLWCLGGPELYRNPSEVDAEVRTDDSCLDLNLRICDDHETISIELFPYDLVPERGGNTIENPRRSDPIELSSDDRVVDEVLGRLESWLDEILVLPA